MLQIYNTLTKKKEDFKPLQKGRVGLYACGPTVYDAAHIGNLRTYIFEDILKRVLLFDGYEVKHVMNITDVDDKIIRRGQGRKAAFEKLTREYEGKFLADEKSLNIILADKLTRATEYVNQMAEFIQALLDRGYAYRAADQSIYFSLAKFPAYGRLSNLDKSGIKAGARVAQDEYDKENPADFALWKAWDENDGEIFWETPLGKGRPGWHIECSAMSNAELGETIDIHAGAVDLIFPHHENEIAQSEARSSKKFVNYWVHGEHLLVDNHKMAKSRNNFYTLADLAAKGYEPLDFRFLVLGAHYRTKLNFTWQGMEGARIARAKLNDLVADIWEKAGLGGAGQKISRKGEINQKFKNKFTELINNDLALPQSMALVWEVAKSDLSAADKYAALIDFDRILGLGLMAIKAQEAPADVINSAEQRLAARKSGDFGKSDELLAVIEEAGYEVEDTKDGYQLKRL